MNGLRIEALELLTLLSLTSGKICRSPRATGHGDGSANHLADLVVEETVSFELDAKK